LFASVRISLDGSARGASHDDATATDADPRTDGRQKEGKALLAERPLERSWHTNVVPHADPTGEFDIPSRAFRPAVQSLRLREAEQRRHALSRDPSFHAAVSALRHRPAHRVSG
jgi:hypothetical protein